jgi:DNA helicase-2/ATP-dependent DNA helicase PcrA
MGASHSAVLPGMEDFDDEPFSVTPNLQKFIDTFEQSEWATRTPFDVEHPFVYSTAGRVVRGVIDAIYQQPDGRWLLVDWKTNAAATADDLQLSLYRVAWARAQGCDIEMVDCAFYYVALDQTMAPGCYYSEQEIAEIVATDETTR